MGGFDNHLQLDHDNQSKKHSVWHITTPEHAMNAELFPLDKVLN